MLKSAHDFKQKSADDFYLVFRHSCSYESAIDYGLYILHCKTKFLKIIFNNVF